MSAKLGNLNAVTILSTSSLLLWALKNSARRFFQLSGPQVYKFQKKVGCHWLYLIRYPTPDQSEGQVLKLVQLRSDAYLWQNLCGHNGGVTEEWSSPLGPAWINWEEGKRVPKREFLDREKSSDDYKGTLPQHISPRFP